MSSNNQTMARDTIIYMLSKIIEGILGVLTISVMSYIYLPSDMGRYSTLNTAITTFAMVLVQWLTQSVYRYISKYNIENRLNEFYSTVFFSWFKINFFILFFGSIFIIFAKVSYSPILLSLCVIMLSTYNTHQLVTALIAGNGKSKLNMLLSIINVVGKLVLLVLLNYLLGSNIELIFLSYIILDLSTAIIGIYKLQVLKYVKYSYFDKEILKLLRIYGYPLMVNLIATSVLNKSDIYVINSYLGQTDTGIYQTNYSIIASAFTLLSIGVMRGSYPTILKEWSKNEKESAGKLLEMAIRNYLLISVPAVVGVFTLSEIISKSLFDVLYHEGHIVMGFVALGMLFLGLTEYAIKPWELNSLTGEIVKRSLFCGILNVLLNIIFIRKFGYIFAGISTIIAFLTYFIITVYGTRNIMKFMLNKRAFFNILISSLIMGVCLHFLKMFLLSKFNDISVNIFTLGIIILIGVSIYFLILYFLGELEKEVAFIKSKRN